MTVFHYEEGSKRIKVTLKNEVLENNHSYECIDKSIFSEWGDGEKIHFSHQLTILKNFKDDMFNRFGVEIDHD